MALSKRAFGQVIIASSQSDSPIDDDVLREIAAERDDDPDALVAQHRQFREEWERRKRDGDAPMPMC